VIAAGLTTVAPTSRTTPTFAGANYRHTAWLSSDGVEMWNSSSTVLWRTVDYWATDTELRTFDIPVRGVRQLDSGELLVALQGDSDSPGEVWRTTGYTRADPTGCTWTKVLTCSYNDTYASGDWLMWCYGDVLLVGEYGAKTAGANARGTYLSMDDGLTWTQIYDWEGSGKHMHGCAHDRYADMLWLCFGDSSQGYAYSTDWRAKVANGQQPTWVEHITNETTGQSDAVQPVGIYPMRDRVIMGTDDTKNGLYRIERDDYDTIVPVFVADSPGTMKTISGMPYRHQDSEDYPLIWPWVRLPGITGEVGVAASYDGLAWHVLWRDSSRGYTGVGPFTCVGPAANGNCYGWMADAIEASGTRLILPFPSWATAAH
jgi:hypothetical protein